MKIIAACLITLFLCTMNITAQEKDFTEQNIGLSASLQSNQMDIMVPIFLSPGFSLAPSIGYSGMSDEYSDLAIGIVGRLYINRDKVSPYLTARYGLLVSSPNKGDTITDSVTGVGAGGEYFISKNFSFGVEAQVNFSFSDKNSTRFGNPGGTNVNTASAFFATIYF